MNKLFRVACCILLIITGYLVYDKVTTRPTTVFHEQRQTSAGEDRPQLIPEDKKINRECLLAAEKFFEKKRADNIDYYSATWNEYYEESSRTCFVGITLKGLTSFSEYTSVSSGVIYNVNTGDTYHLVGTVLVRTDD